MSYLKYNGRLLRHGYDPSVFDPIYDEDTGSVLFTVSAPGIVTVRTRNHFGDCRNESEMDQLDVLIQSEAPSRWDRGAASSGSLDDLPMSGDYRLYRESRGLYGTPLYCNGDGGWFCLLEMRELVRRSGDEYVRAGGAWPRLGWYLVHTADIAACVSAMSSATEQKHPVAVCCQESSGLGDVDQMRYFDLLEAVPGTLSGAKKVAARCTFIGPAGGSHRMPLLPIVSSDGNLSSHWSDRLVVTYVTVVKSRISYIYEITASDEEHGYATTEDTGICDVVAWAKANVDTRVYEARFEGDGREDEFLEDGTLWTGVGYTMLSYEAEAVHMQLHKSGAYLVQTDLSSAPD